MRRVYEKAPADDFVLLENVDWTKCYGFRMKSGQLQLTWKPTDLVESLQYDGVMETYDRFDDADISRMLRNCVAEGEVFEFDTVQEGLRWFADATEKAGKCD